MTGTCTCIHTCKPFC